MSSTRHKAEKCFPTSKGHHVLECLKGSRSTHWNQGTKWDFNLISDWALLFNSELLIHLGQTLCNPLKNVNYLFVVWLLGPRKINSSYPILWLVFHVDTWPDTFWSHTETQQKITRSVEEVKEKEEGEPGGWEENAEWEHLFQWHSAICSQCCMTNMSKSRGQCFEALCCHSDISNLNLLCERCSMFYYPRHKNPMKFCHGEECWRMPKHNLKSHT